MKAFIFSLYCSSAWECDALDLWSFGTILVEDHDVFLDISGEGLILRILGSGANT